eukprot:jgi/Mesvir1/21374/Mv20858-RA.1
MATFWLYFAQGPQYVCTNFNTFVCTACSGIHREFSHRIKSVSMASFTPEEVKALQEGGNKVAKAHFFQTWSPHELPIPDSSAKIDKVREFIRLVYVEKRFVSAGGRLSPVTLDKHSHATGGAAPKATDPRKDTGRSPLAAPVQEHQSEVINSIVNSVMGRGAAASSNNRDTYGSSKASEPASNHSFDLPPSSSGVSKGVPSLAPPGSRKPTVVSVDHGMGAGSLQLPSVQAPATTAAPPAPAAAAAASSLIDFGFDAPLEKVMGELTVPAPQPAAPAAAAPASNDWASFGGGGFGGGFGDAGAGGGSSSSAPAPAPAAAAHDPFAASSHMGGSGAGGGGGDWANFNGGSGTGGGWGSTFVQQPAAGAKDTHAPAAPAPAAPAKDTKPAAPTTPSRSELPLDLFTETAAPVNPFVTHAAPPPGPSGKDPNVFSNLAPLHAALPNVPQKPMGGSAHHAPAPAGPPGTFNPQWGAAPGMKPTDPRPPGAYPPQGYGAPGMPGYGAPPPYMQQQMPYGAPPGQYGAPPGGQPPYGYNPYGAPGAPGMPPQGYGAPQGYGGYGGMPPPGAPGAPGQAPPGYWQPPGPSVPAAGGAARGNNPFA